MVEKLKTQPRFEKMTPLPPKKIMKSKLKMGEGHPLPPPKKNFFFTFLLKSKIISWVIKFDSLLLKCP